MPAFQNLLKLSFESDKERGWQVVPLLLNSSPNLETLVNKVNTCIYQISVDQNTHLLFFLLYMNFFLSISGTCAQSY